MKLNGKDTERINWTNSHALLGSIKNTTKSSYMWIWNDDYGDGDDDNKYESRKNKECKKEYLI